MDIGELDIHLRRRQHIEDAMGKQPRLPGTLRQLGAVGAVTRPGGPGSQRAFVKVMPVKSTGTRQHLAYLQYQKGQHQTHAPLYGPGAAIHWPLPGLRSRTRISSASSLARRRTS